MRETVVHLEVHKKSWPLVRPFVISRGAKTEAVTVIVELRSGSVCGRGESVPYARYGETIEGVIASIMAISDEISEGLDRDALQKKLPPGAARNALDLALWDLDAKRTRTPVWQLAKMESPQPVVSAYTLSLGTPHQMAEIAASNLPRPIFKLKLTGMGDIERVRSVRLAAPSARLIVDANEGWSVDQLVSFGPLLADLGVDLIEQPLEAGKDSALATIPHVLPLCADESCHVTEDLGKLIYLYDYVNIKLDKTGGLTEALRLLDAAKVLGFKVMVGCMVASSLATAPALILAQRADLVDLDGPLMLDKDYQPSLVFDGSTVYPPSPSLWG